MVNKKYAKYIKIALWVLPFAFMTFVMRSPLWVILLVYFLGLVVYALMNFSSAIAIFGNYMYVSGKQNAGIKLIRKAIQLDTKSPTAYLNYSILLVREGNGKEALNYIEKAERLSKNILTSKNIQLTKGSCYWVLGEIDNAIEVLEKMRTTYDYVNANALTTLGFMYFLKDDYDKAEEITRLALADSPESGSAWDNIGQIYLKKGDNKEAKEAFLKAVQYKSDLVDSYYFLGVIAEADNEPDKAREYFVKADNCDISSLNTVTKAQIQEKLNPKPVE